MAKRIIIAAVAAVAVIAAAGGIFWWSHLPPGDAAYESVELMAEQEGAAGVEPGSAFRLTAEGRLGEEDVRTMLSFDPPVEYALERAEDGWRLTPSAPLEENKVYSAAVKNPQGKALRSFAFQTRTDLMVSSTYPSDGEEYVETATGIEITLNAAGADIEGALRIEPPVEGTLEPNPYGATFIPAAALETNCRYRVTLSGGLAAADGRQLREDYVFSFTTHPSEEERNHDDDLRLRGGDGSLFLPGDEPRIPLEAGEDLSEIPYQTVIHRYPSAQAYIEAMKERDRADWERPGKRGDYRADVSSLEAVSSVTAELETADGYSYSAALPSTLGSGFYIATISGESADGYPQSVQYFFQVADLALYAQSSDGEALVWLNDPVTGKAISEARCVVEKLDGMSLGSGVTDGEGLARLSLELEPGDEWVQPDRTYLRLLDGEDPVCFLPLNVIGRQEERLRDRCQAALYTDRELYRNSDAMRFWGVLRMRGNAPAPSKVYAALYATWPREELYRVEAAVGQDGTFSGELPYEALRSDHYTLAVTDGGEGEEHFYYSKNLQVEDYTKPALVIDVTHEKTWYYADEPIDFTISAHYYDGTPVAGGRFRLTGYELAGPDGAPLEEDGLVVTLDAYGRAAVSARYKPSQGEDVDYLGWSPSAVYYSVSSADAQDLYLSSSGWVRVVPSRHVIDTQYEDGSLTIRTASIDESRLDPAIQRDYEQYPTVYDWFAKAPEELDVSVRLVRHAYVDVPDGVYYDKVEKKNVTRYRTERRESVVGTYAVRTAGGTVVIGDLPVIFEIGEKASYEAYVTIDGGLGYTAGTSHDIRRPRQAGDDSEDIVRYTFTPSEAQNSVPDGGEAALGVYRSDEKLGEGRALYALLHRGILDTGIFTGEKRFSFTEKLQPALYVQGAYFDGRHIHPMENSYFSLDTADKTLAVAVSADRERYRPAETAKLTVTLRDAAGKPTAGTACVGVVDESVFALAEQKLDLVAMLYGNRYYPRTARLLTMSEETMAAEAGIDGLPNPGTGGLGDEGLSPAIRRQFEDIALFQTVEIGESGEATLELTLPDNVTQWRLTAGAVTDDLRAGSGTGGAIATLPFVVRPLATDTYLEGDDIHVSLLSSGGALGDAVDYTVSVRRKDADPIEKKASGAVGAQKALELGKLSAGDYTLAATGTCGELQDAVELPFSVVKPGLMVRRVRDVSLEELAALEPMRYPVTATLYDRAMEPYMRGLEALCRQRGDRTEINAAHYAAQILRDRLSGEETELPGDGLLDDIQPGEGVRPLPHAEADPATTAKMLLAAPEWIQSGRAREYLRQELRDPAATPDGRVMAYLGLAAGKEPVLLDVRREAADAGHTPLRRLYLGCALALLGDREGALALYGENKPPETADEETQGAALMLAALTGHDDADARALALCEALEADPQDRTAPANLELLVYLKNFPLEQRGGAEVTYFLDGKKTTKELAPCETVALTRESLAQADFRSDKGDVRALAQYDAFDDTPASSGSIRVDRTIEALDGGELGVPKLAKVTLEVRFSKDAPEGLYAVTDRIASGMRYVETRSDYGKFDGDFLAGLTQEDQMVRGSIWLSRGDDDVMPLERGSGKPNPGTEDFVLPEPEAEEAAEAASESVAENATAAKLSIKKTNPGVAAIANEEAEEQAPEVPVKKNPVTDDVAGEPETEESEPRVKPNPSTENIAEEEPVKKPNPSADIVEEEEPEIAEDYAEEENPAEPPNVGEDSDGNLIYRLVYYVNCALPGEYLLPGTVVEKLDGTLVGKSEPSSVTVRAE